MFISLYLCSGRDILGDTLRKTARRGRLDNGAVLLFDFRESDPRLVPLAVQV